MPETLAGIEEETFATPETTPISERVVVAPRDGRFRPGGGHERGEWIARGQELAAVEAAGEQVPVRSPFQGWVMGALAHPGQPVRQGQALFWVRS